MSFSAYCPIEGGQLFYEISGKGEPLILIHAGIAHHKMWDAQVEAFSKTYQVIRYDLRSDGKSSTEAIDFYHHEDLHALVTHLNLEKVHLCAVSMGGKIALEYALSYPDHVASLIITATGLVNDPEQNQQEKDLFAEMEALEEAGDWEKVAAIDVRLFVDGPMSPEGRADAAVRQKVKVMALSNYLNYYKQFPTANGFEPEPQAVLPSVVVRLSEINVPLLTMVGSLDISRAQFSSDLLAKELALAKQIIIEDTAHLPNMEKPELFNQHALEFLRSLN